LRAFHLAPFDFSLGTEQTALLAFDLPGDVFEVLALDDDIIAGLDQFRYQEIRHPIAKFPLSFGAGVILEGSHGDHRGMHVRGERRDGTHQGRAAPGEKYCEGKTHPHSFCHFQDFHKDFIIYTIRAR